MRIDLTLRVENDKNKNESNPEKSSKKPQKITVEQTTQNQYRK